MLRSGVAVAVLFLSALIAASCSSSRKASAFDLSAEWKHTESKDGLVTTIQTTQGSVWRGRAQLVEELAIGSETGAEPYLFGQIAGIAGREDRIFVLDSKISVLRMFDGQGYFLRDIARKGEGPGEFVSPSSLVVNPRDGPAIPDFKPAYKGLFTDLSGRIWILRQGRGRRVQDCRETPANIRQYQESPCWIDSLLVDVFEETGRYLGEVEVPERLQFSPPPFIRDGLVLAVVVDADGNERVKRFRLTLP